MRVDIKIEGMSRQIFAEIRDPKDKSQLTTIQYENKDLETVLKEELVPWIMSKVEEPEKKDAILALHKLGKSVDEICNTLAVDRLYVHRVIVGIR